MNRLFIIMIASALTAASCKHKNEPEAAQKFVLSDTMLAKTGFAQAAVRPVYGSLKLFGKISADNSRMAQVFPVAGGSVVKVNVELGDYVKKGSVLAVIRSGEVAEYERQKMEAVNDVTIAEKNLQVAKDMFAGKLSSEKDVLTAEKELQNAKASLRRIDEVFKIYNIGQGAAYNVVAPISGFIIDRNITENMQLRNDRTENIFSIAEIDEVWVLANVNETDIGKITVGMEAEVRTVSYPDRVLKGSVDKIFNMLDDNTKAMKVRIRIPNKDLALKPEMSATVSLHIKENRELLAIPASAVIFDKSKNWVMVYKGRDNIQTREVEVYRQNADTTYISKGLDEGETVISRNQMLIYDALND